MHGADALHEAYVAHGWRAYAAGLVGQQACICSAQTYDMKVCQSDVGIQLQADACSLLTGFMMTHIAVFSILQLAGPPVGTARQSAAQAICYYWELSCNVGITCFTLEELHTSATFSQMYMLADRPTMDTRTFFSLASAIVFRMSPGSHVARAASRISTCNPVPQLSSVWCTT